MGNAKFVLETAHAAMTSDDEDTVEVAREMFTKACFMLGRVHTKLDNLNWRNYYVAVGLEEKTGIILKQAHSARKRMFKRIPLKFCLQMCAINLKPNSMEKISAEIKLSNGLKVSIELHDGIIDFEISKVVEDASCISEADFRDSLG